jgi:hypothetical protein
MAIIVTDAASSVVDFLKVGAGAADIRAMIQGGANGILEAGDLKGTTITEQLAARRAVSADSLVLCVDVQDAGDRPVPVDKRLQTVVVRIYDQDKGYRNIRAVRDQIIKDLDGYVSSLTSVDGEKRGFLELSYLERSGIRYDSRFAVDFEAIAFRGIVDIEEGD